MSRRNNILCTVTPTYNNESVTLCDAYTAIPVFITSTYKGESSPSSISTGSISVKYFDSFIGVS